ncbi:MAG: acylneuraminate cytidylyltransferase family protein [Nitrosopumilus sp.]|nr:acylneuraminate cytidylyltransferase family protein [Nitrosopumilus sp.]
MSSQDKSENILALITARGGSKGVPRKNIRMLCGKPLIAWTIEVALSVCEQFHSVVVSTEDEEIAEVARKYGAKVPFMRPAELAQDETPSLPVVQHAVRFIEGRDSIRLDWVMILQPTEPLRLAEDIIECLHLSRQGECDSVISVKPMVTNHPILMKKIVDGQLLPYCLEEKEGTRRQDYDPPAYKRNGAIFLIRRDVLMEKNSIWGQVIRPYVMPEERSVGIDTDLDFKLAELLMGERLDKAE